MRGSSFPVSRPPRARRLLASAASVAACCLVLSGCSLLGGRGDAPEVPGAGANGGAGAGAEPGMERGVGQAPAPLAQLGIPHSAPLVGPDPGSTKEINLPSGRAYRLHVPRDYAAEKQWPVVLVFHGWMEEAAKIESYSQFDSAEAIVAYPQGVDKAWSPAPYAVTTGEEDLDFVDDVIDTIRATYAVDDSRIFATGMSNGGGFAAYLGCTRPEVFRAVATVSAAYYDGIHEGCSDQPVARFDMHGTHDPVVNYYGGTRHKAHYSSVEAILAADAKRNGCSGPVRTSRLVNSALEMNWQNCAEPLQHIRVAGGEHVWPGGKTDKATHVGGGFATDRVLDFFGIPGRPSGTQQT